MNGSYLQNGMLLVLRQLLIAPPGNIVNCL